MNDQPPPSTLPAYEEDIPMDAARAAHAGLSMVPDDRARQERSAYARMLQDDYEYLAQYVDTPEKRRDFEVQFADYRTRLRRHKLAQLGSMSRVFSPMIVGPSRFPVRRQAKLNETARRRAQELLDFRERAVAYILKTLRPELRPIMVGDADAQQRLRAKIAQVGQTQELMKATNAALRKNQKADPATRIAALVALGHRPEKAGELVHGDSLGRTGYPDYALRNNCANTRRLEQRLQTIERTQASPIESLEGANARLEDSPPENRVRLFFPGKPDAAVRDRLKTAGFRWTPSLGCWQAYRNPASLEVARQVAEAAQEAPSLLGGLVQCPLTAARNKLPNPDGADAGLRPDEETGL